MNKDGNIHFRIGDKREQKRHRDAVRRSGVNESMFCRFAVRRAADHVAKHGELIK